MKVVRLRSPGGLDNLEFGTEERAELRRGEMRVRFHATSLNYHDLSIVLGKLKTPDSRIPMSDGSGEVIEIGEGMIGFAPGDRVMSLFFPLWAGGGASRDIIVDVPGDYVDGYAREEAVVSAYAFTHVPKGYSHAEAATLPCAALTAWNSLMAEPAVKPGDSVLVQGTGGVSIFALQFAKAAGAHVIATSSSNEKLERLKGLGADAVINYRETPEWGKAVRGLTDGRGVDHVVEVGGAGTLGQSITAVRTGGHIALVGVLSGYAAEISTVTIMARQIRVHGIGVGSREQQLAMSRAIEANGIRPIIDSSFPLESIADAFRHQQSNRHFGKIVLEW